MSETGPSAKEPGISLQPNEQFSKVSRIEKAPSSGTDKEKFSALMRNFIKERRAIPRVLTAALLTLGLSSSEMQSLDKPVESLVKSEQGQELPLSPEEIQTVETIVGMPYSEIQSEGYKISFPVKAGEGSPYKDS